MLGFFVILGAFAAFLLITSSGGDDAQLSNFAVEYRREVRVLSVAVLVFASLGVAVAAVIALTA